ncbi:MAG TPA: hypothetical protein VEC38_10955 [Candidatus Binataceae bacterium]|nr:hypothetical protein [Candidatus Binataceae bacterium]
MSSPELEGSPGLRIAGEPPPERAYESWMPDRLSASIVGLALAIGACLRFYRLGAYELTADEAQSWYAAAAPTLGYVVRVALVLNPGKLGLHELALHFWILAFGESVVSMRALSAILGVLCIQLVFAVARELLELNVPSPSGLPHDEANRIAAVSALIFALCLPAIHYSREARLYPLILALTLAQVWCFIRAARFGRLLHLLGAACLSFPLVAANLANVAVLAAEGAWLLGLFRRSGWRPTSPLSRRAWNLAGSLIPGVATMELMVVTDPSGVYWATHLPFQRAGAVSFMQMARMAPLNAMCVLAIGLAAWGTIRGWRQARAAIWLALLWMWLPVVILSLSLRALGPLFLIILSFWFPNFLQRYVLTCIVPFCILIALGVWRIRPNAIRLGAVALLAGLALARIPSYYASPGEGVREWGIQWREAAAFAASEAEAGRPISVHPDYCKYVVKYYARNSTIVPPPSTDAHLIIVANYAGDLSDPDVPLLRGEYLRDVTRLEGVSVWSDR